MHSSDHDDLMVTILYSSMARNSSSTSSTPFNGTNNESTMPEKHKWTSHSPYWQFNVDILLVSFLAVISMIANLGLLYLAQRTRPTHVRTHSTLHRWMNTRFFKCRRKPLDHTIESSNLPQRRASHVCTDDAYYSTTISPNGMPLRKCASSASIFRTNALSSANPNGPVATAVAAVATATATTAISLYATPLHHRTPRSRRYKRYVRGLYGLSFSNIAVALSLLIWCVTRLMERAGPVVIPWLAAFGVANNAMADLAHTIEIGAVLWIALERTLGIHWPRTSRRPSSADQQHQKRKSVANLGREVNFKKRCCWWWSNCFSSQTLNETVWGIRMIRLCSASSRILLSCLPCTLFVLAAIPELVRFLQYTSKPEHSNQSMNPTVIFISESILFREEPGYIMPKSNGTTQLVSVVYYYTNRIVFALVAGQFLAPLAVLITTNLLIYRKVASRDKWFFSRQSSNMSKSSFISNLSTTGISMNATLMKTVVPPPTQIIPVLRILESSQTDLNDSNDGKSTDFKRTTTESKEKSVNLLPLPDMTTGPCSLMTRMNQRRGSTPAYCSGFDRSDSPLSNEGKLTINSPTQMRRKSSNDILAALFQTRPTERTTDRMGDDTVLLQMLRRQHRRTLRVLIILLLVFVTCRAPRAIVLMIDWLQSSFYLCQEPTYAHTWLLYATLWAHTSTVFDTIVYGFWGNRTYRLHLRAACCNKM